MKKEFYEYNDVTSSSFVTYFFLRPIHYVQKRRLATTDPRLCVLLKIITVQHYNDEISYMPYSCINLMTLNVLRLENYLA